jgi:hypothetical protein
VVDHPAFQVVYPNVAYPRRGKTRQSAPNVRARRLGQDEQYLTVREILSQASTLADGALSRERSDFYRFEYATLGFPSVYGADALQRRIVEMEQSGTPILKPNLYF